MHDIIISFRSEPPRDRLSACCLIVGIRVDVVPGEEHGGMACFVIQLLECCCNADASCQLCKLLTSCRYSTRLQRLPL